MSWNLIIFAFGFIVGGFTIMLLVGVLSLINRPTAASEGKALETDPGPATTKAKIYPLAPVLHAVKNRDPATGSKANVRPS